MERREALHLFFVPRHLATTRAPLGAPPTAFVAAPGRAFGEPSASSSALQRQFPSAGCRASELRASARLSRQPAPGRGSLVSPGGAPAPPGCAPCEGTRAGAAPAPPRERL